eukprot:1161981-Pelagomonas_calceolata.AAC.4
MKKHTIKEARIEWVVGGAERWLDRVTRSGGMSTEEERGVDSALMVVPLLEHAEKALFIVPLFEQTERALVVVALLGHVAQQAIGPARGAQQCQCKQFYPPLSFDKGELWLLSKCILLPDGSRTA